MKAVANNDEQWLQNIYFIGAREVNIKVGLFLRFQRQLKIVSVKSIQLQPFRQTVQMLYFIHYQAFHSAILHFQATWKYCPLSIKFLRKRTVNNPTNFL